MSLFCKCLSLMKGNPFWKLSKIYWINRVYICLSRCVKAFNIIRTNFIKYQVQDTVFYVTFSKGVKGRGLGALIKCEMQHLTTFQFIKSPLRIVTAKSPMIILINSKNSDTNWVVNVIEYSTTRIHAIYVIKISLFFSSC